MMAVEPNEQQQGYETGQVRNQDEPKTDVRVEQALAWNMD